MRDHSKKKPRTYVPLGLLTSVLLHLGALALLILLAGCTMLEARYIPVCEGSPIITPCRGFCNVSTRGTNGVLATRRIPNAILITDQTGKLACEEVSS